MGNLPLFAQGRKRTCWTCGEEWQERKMIVQEKHYKCPRCVDALTEKQRSKQKLRG